MSTTGAKGTDERTFLARLRQFAGRPAGDPRMADDPVNLPMIRHWCQALGDANPVYTDAEFAAASVFGTIVAPPTMLQSWTHHDRRFTPEQAGDDNAEEQLVQLLAEHGFESVVATNCEQTYMRYLRPGDRLSYQAVIEGVSEQKTTALGAGHFITTLVTYTDQHGDTVGRMRFRLLRFRPRD